MKILLGVQLLTCLWMYVNAQCETVCPTPLTTRYHVCVGERTFQLCKTAGLAPVTTKTYSCPQGTVCTNAPSRCVKGQAPICKSGCGVCDPATHVTCLSKLVYAFCFDGKPDPNVNGTCLPTEICTADKPLLCGPVTDRPSCNQEEVHEIPKNGTGSPTGDPREFCRQKNQPGRYSAGDVDCRKYNYCYPLNGQMEGKVYSCPGTTRFDCQKQTCEATCNSNCNLQHRI